MKKILSIAILISVFSNYFSQVTTTVNPTIAQIQQKLSGNGITVSNVILTCPSGAYALYSGGTGALSSISSGILLTTGSAANVQPSATNLSVNTATPGSALGDQLDLSGNGTFDECSMKFLITPSCNTLSIKYVFASEEYPENVGALVSDVFGFVIDGPNPAGGNYSQTNIALVPGTNLPVSIDNVNYDPGIPPFFPATCTNCTYYVDAPAGMVYDGCTTILTASTQVIPCSQYTMTIGVWDVGDHLYDSGVFLDVNGLSCVGSPTITATVNPTVICGPQTVTLTASGAAATGSYTWAAPASGGLTSTTGTVVTANPTAATTYSLLYSDVNTCPGSPIIKTTTLSFSTTPSFSVSQSPASICAGQSTTLTANGGAGTYSWSPTTGLSPTTGSVVVCTPTGSTTYTVTKTSGGCTSSTVVTVNTSSAPTVSITPSSSSICSGQSVALSASGTGPFNWIASSGAFPPATGNVTVTPTTTTTYTVISGTGTCTSSAVATVSIAATLSINITPSVSTICAGQTVTLTASGVSPFVWTASSGTNPSASGTVVVSPTTTTTYTVLSGSGTCTATATASINVSSGLTITSTPASTSICNGSSTTLTAGGATTYTWLPSSSNLTSISVNPSTTTTYTLIGANGVCSNSTTATVSVTTISTSVSASSPFYCVGVSPVTLTGSGASTYSWSTGATSSSISVTPSITTTYTVVGTTNGCSSTQTISITAPPITNISSTTSNSVICAGGTGATLTASGASTYTWSPSSTTSSTLGVNPTSTTSYSVIGQTAAGCITNSAVVTVSVLPTINPTLTASTATVCLNNTVSITSTPTSSGLTYTWMPTTAIQGASNTSSIVILPTSTAAVVYTVFVSNGVCSGANTLQITANVAPIGNFIVHNLSNDTVCVGGCVTFSSTTTGTSPISYQWFYQSGVGTSSVGPTPEACYPSAGSFSVMMIATNVCGIDTVVKNNFVNVFDIPTLTVSNDTTINIGESATISASGGLTYNWYPNVNGTISCPTCASTVVQPTVTTNYIVVASNSIYCRVQDTVTVIVDVNCGDFFIPNVFSPNDDGLNDMINVHGRCIVSFNLQIFNRWGEKVFETSSMSDGWDGTFKGQKLDTGVFVYKADGVSIDGQSFNLKGNITLIR